MQLNMHGLSLPPAATVWRAFKLSLSPGTQLSRLTSLKAWTPRQAQVPLHPLRTCAAAAVAESAGAAAGPDAAGPLSSLLRANLALYNTLSRGKEAFRPRPDQGDNVSMYVCGVTVYDFSHIGHARVYVAFDVLYRLLRGAGYNVTYVRNFTDVDDKIIARAALTGEDPLALSRRFAAEFHADMDVLRCERPTLEPRATDHIPDMVAAIQRIIQHGHAYEAQGDVYFDVASLPGYGALSRRSQDDNRAGERVAVDGRKRGPADFALWKAAKPGEPTWESPWGPGRPGWHIECSAMINALLGPTVDIHGGGQDLVFPHHENELAQARAAAGPCSCGQPHAAAAENSSGQGEEGQEQSGFARYWVHNGFVNVDAEKMSKSLGNFFTIREVLLQYHPAALRWFLVSTQYRQPVNYTQRALEEASDRVYYLYQCLYDAEQVLQAAEGSADTVQQAAAEVAEGKGPGGALTHEALTALADDINSPAAVAALSAPLKAINDLVHTKKGRKQADRVQVLASLREGLRATLGLLGLWPDDAAATLAELRALALTRAGLTEERVQAAIEQRAAARAAKDYAASDAVRLNLETVGVLIMDTPQGTSWKPGPRLNIAAEDGAADTPTA